MIQALYYITDFEEYTHIPPFEKSIPLERAFPPWMHLFFLPQGTYISTYLPTDEKEPFGQVTYIPV